ncbi:hypothetical protein A2526_00035 [candidate division WOR-1 bacterium RIFOXYD2_FULL_36_8]|uniref:Type II secretion system protein GspF domain-containing protein n=1 Tax=candidate division WOR-1 bacterium RIFOXYB2_FULL_36_35 TaxID=1802578 RepID=A0A1F4S4E8_UNCSA|nr:MAG: hypothetical protein A2230_08040 [candidate division WOR-1 bacterium RIFOXYA2_FULL_36_21]OGC14313.1 MAG: hypothetical protein A2282_00120 [candidate division WOR-1 bacterium RIFOXYA12_FULL_36_13]OGC15312.1 MAG: hypothetical protein A2290_05135 [candidate division WOR-1 bacterium RIFOXYB2_FULL_36_35]OGC37591.1 MAG: hypothetical protein A2526_00035 [candidate division WOR-1 bacterium RIFOXYD2_FULL_36_8]
MNFEFFERALNKIARARRKTTLKASFFKQLASLLKTGIPLNKALKFLALHSDEKTKRNFAFISSRLEEGISFSRAIYEEGLISREIRNILKIAEENSMLEETLFRASAFLDRRDKFKKMLKTSLTYPFIVLIMSIFSFLGMIFFVLPSYSDLFSAFDFKLPLISRIAMVLPYYSWVLIFLLFILVFFVHKIFTDFDFCIKFPLAGNIRINMLMSDFCYSLSCQLKSGVSFVEAFHNFIDGLNSNVFKLKASLVVDKIRKGSSLSFAFASASDKLFNGLFVQLLAVGEESGRLADVLWEGGESFSEQVEYDLKNLASYIEPAATLLVGGVVAFVALAMIMPLFEMVNSLL